MEMNPSFVFVLVFVFRDLGVDAKNDSFICMVLTSSIISKDTFNLFKHLREKMDCPVKMEHEVGNNGTLLTTIILQKVVLEEIPEARPKLILADLSGTLTTIAASLLLIRNDSIFIAVTKGITHPSHVFLNEPLFFSSYDMVFRENTQWLFIETLLEKDRLNHLFVFILCR